MPYRPTAAGKINKLPQRFVQQIGAGAGANLKPFPRQNAADPGASNGIIPGRTPRPAQLPPMKLGKVVNPKSHSAKLLGS